HRGGASSRRDGAFSGAEAHRQSYGRTTSARVASGGSEMNEFWVWLLVSLCLGLSFLMSGMEAGVFALSRLRVRQQMRAGRRSAQAFHQYLENPENFLWTIFVGNTIANLIVLGWLVSLLHKHLQHHQLWFIVIFSVAVFFFYAFSDLLPKMMFRH